MSRAANARAAAIAPAFQSLSFDLRPVPPFRLDLAVWTLRRRPENILDRWDGETYRRALPLDSEVVEIAVHQSGATTQPRLIVNARAKHFPPGAEPSLRAVVERTLGTRIDLSDFYAFAARQKHLKPLVASFAGFKPPRYPTVFEALLNAISCQQVSLHVGIMLLNRLVQTFGRPASADPSVHACPSPIDIAGLAPGTLHAMGFSRQKERALLELSRAIAENKLDIESFAELDDAAALEHLTAIRGVGRWSAEYTLLRGLGRLNVFPGDDVGGWNKLQKHLRLRKRPDYEKTRKLLAPWKAYAGLIYFHFLLDGLRDRGVIS